MWPRADFGFLPELLLRAGRDAGCVGWGCFQETTCMNPPTTSPALRQQLCDHACLPRPEDPVQPYNGQVDRHSSQSWLQPEIHRRSNGCEKLGRREKADSFAFSQKATL
eukprot:scaffold81666_cov50-Prasinocladus_malaysianus.AAC.1